MLCAKTIPLAMEYLASLEFPAYRIYIFPDVMADRYSESGFRGYLNSMVVRLLIVHLEEISVIDCHGLMQTKFSQLPKDATNSRLLPHQGSIREHIRRVNISQQIIYRLIEEKRVQDDTTPVLLLCPRSIRKRVERRINETSNIRYTHKKDFAPKLHPARFLNGPLFRNFQRSHT